MDSNLTGPQTSGPHNNNKYRDALSWLYSRLPMFSRVGAAAYKPGLQTTEALDRHFGHPHRQFKSIHVGGTNGKGSTSHSIAAALQANGYKVGLYTSPHLVDFRERIRVNGEMIPEQAVVDFVEKWKSTQFDGHPSFFELTMMMAFCWFAKEAVDYAVIEVGMGGRLDSTNVITPLMSVITNISKDHTQFLGDTLEKIAGEKAGIIKPGIPVVIGESIPETYGIFKEAASAKGSPIIYAEDAPDLLDARSMADGALLCKSATLGELRFPLGGSYQIRNLNTVLKTLDLLDRRNIVRLNPENTRQGLENVVELTGFQGRWQIVERAPLVICDTGHNHAGLSATLAQLKALDGKKLRMVIGFVNDKDVDNIVSLFPKEAEYYFTQARIPRAMPATRVAEIFRSRGISGRIIPDVAEACKAALADADPSDTVYIGGSTFIVADFLASRQ